MAEPAAYPITHVAVKFLLPELLRHADLVERFSNEARAMASVQHPNVAQIYSFGWMGETPFFVMEYAAGQTADRTIEAANRRNTFLPLGEALRILDGAAAGLAAVHRAGVVHRDVKPANLIDQPERERVVLMDFGIGHRVVSGAPAGAGGSPAYCAPELLSGRDVRAEDEHLADIYSLGVTAFELLTGELPGPSEGLLETVTWHLGEAPVAPSTLRPGLPPGLDEVVLRCLAKDPGARYVSCQELRADLAPLIEDLRSWPQPRRPRKTPTPVPRSSGVVARQAAVVLVRPGPALERRARRAVELAGLEARIETARSVDEALARLRAAGFGVVVSRLHDPDRSGFELAAEVAGDPALRRVGVVVTADDVEPSEAHMLGRLGVAGMLLRPVTNTAMAMALQRALSPEVADRQVG